MRVTEVYELDQSTKLELPLFSSRVPAGFPSPGDDYIDQTLDLNELVKHPSDTYLVKVEGDSMINAGIYDGDILIVDRAMEAENNKVIVANLDGELTVKRLSIKDTRVLLMPDNPKYEPIEIRPLSDFRIMGVVTFVIHRP